MARYVRALRMPEGQLPVGRVALSSDGRAAELSRELEGDDSRKVRSFCRVYGPAGDIEATLRGEPGDAFIGPLAIDGDGIVFAGVSLTRLVSGLVGTDPTQRPEDVRALVRFSDGVWGGTRWVERWDWRKDVRRRVSLDYDVADLLPRSAGILATRPVGRRWEVWDHDSLAVLQTVDFGGPLDAPTENLIWQAGASADGARTFLHRSWMNVLDRRTHDLRVMSVDGPTRVLTGVSGEVTLAFSADGAELWGATLKGRRLTALAWDITIGKKRTGVTRTLDEAPEMLLSSALGRVVVLHFDRIEVFDGATLQTVESIDASLPGLEDASFSPRHPPVFAPDDRHVLLPSLRGGSIVALDIGAALH